MGEIMFRGNIVMKGYLKNPASTAAAFEGGWFHTGDLAVLEPDRYAKIRFEEIPKTSTGKIQKFPLRERARSSDAID